MDEEEAALLAELRAISDGSASTSRFADSNNNNNADGGGGGGGNANGVGTSAAAETAAAPALSAEKDEEKPTPALSPWRRAIHSLPAGAGGAGGRSSRRSKTTKEKKVEEGAAVTDVTAAAAPPAEVAAAVAADVAKEAAGPSNSSTSTTTFVGERGGAAENAELLALLSSAQSSGAGRFDNDESDGGGGGGGGGDDTIATAAAAAAAAASTPPEPVIPAEQQQQPSPPAPSQPTKPRGRGGDGELPPWKRRGRNSNAAAKQDNSTDDAMIDVVVAAPPPKVDTAAAVAEPEASPAAGGGFGMSDPSTNTFAGERGGAAEDAELLALLRGVSAKSSSASRFDDGGGGGGGDDDEQVVAAAPSFDENNASKQGQQSAASASTAAGADTATEDTSTQKAPEESVPAPKAKPLPPWKRLRSKARSFANATIDVVVAAAPAASEAEPTAAIEEPVDQVQGVAPTTCSSTTEEVPSYGIKSDAPSTFTGDRGGTAEDAELLALLRGVSAKSSSASRFGDGNDNDGTGNAAAAENNNDDTKQDDVVDAKEPVPSPKLKNSRGNGELPPWKRRGSQNTRTADKQDVAVDVVVAAPRPTSAAKESAVVTKSEAATDPTGGIKSDTPSTFTGERGGTAEDPELLALLRGISAKSSGADRFGVGGDADDGGGNINAEDVAVPQMSPKPRSRHELSPVMRRGSNTSTDKHQTVTSVVAAAPAVQVAELESTDPMSEPPLHGIKSDIQSTFSGERGGAAEDPELLALLRGVSAKSSSANRFNTGEDDVGAAGGSQEAAIAKAPAPVPSSSKPNNRRGDGKLPPWKRRGPNAGVTKETVDVVVAAPAPSKAAPSTSDAGGQVQPSYGIKSDIPSAFSGERGGAAEDAELLALLRGVSTKSSGASRFAEGDAVGTGAAAGESSGTTPPDIQQSPTPQRTQQVAFEDASPQPGAVSGFPGLGPTPDAEEEPLSRDDLPVALSDKNWKVRGKAYDLLKEILLEMVEGRDDVRNIDANQVIEGLDGRIPMMMEDSNVSALDRALDFSILYAEHCSGAAAPEQAGKIVSSILKKNGLASRPTTSKTAGSLVLKLMEVGTESLSSVHTVIEVLLKEGLKSKKPKVVQASATLILDAAREFGAATLPLASITSSFPQILSHSNASVRNTGIQLLAEICRALGSKVPVQDIIDGMKNAQVSELDALLTEQPEATPARTRLRSFSSEDAVAALEGSAKELEAQRLAARPAVDLIAALSSKTDYSSRINLAKWSEKVAALNMVLECGGEKPYKLVQPSPSVNYLPLIGEMKRLLAHTHFAVCSKSMEVLSMLAEGVGEKLFPYLRPQLTPLFKLSKDKKLTRSVGTCLDSMFGNVFGFGHLLDRDDAIPFAVDESNEKNAVARASALEFLSRCVQRNDSAGPRGSLTASMASDVASLCASKLDDSNASVRKAALETLQALEQSSDPDVKKVASKTIDSLKQSNPRAYKALTKSAQEPVRKTATGPARAATGQVKAKAESRGSSGLAEAKARAKRPERQANLKRPIPDPSRPDSGSNSNEVIQVDFATDRPPMSFDAALNRCSGLHIPQWDAPEVDGGILVGLKSSKWMLRQDAIKSITAFLESGRLNGSKDIAVNCCSLLIVVEEHTRAFKETNVNIMKAIIQLFLAVSECHETIEKPINTWEMKSGVGVAMSKIADKKLSTGCKSLLTEMCVVYHPHEVLLEGFRYLQSVKSPVAHEEYLGWIRSFYGDFGAAAIGSGLTDLIPFLLEELVGSNVKVKRAALLSFGSLHAQLGPQFKALTLSLAKPNLKDELEGCFQEHPFDPSYQSTEWPKSSLAVRNAASTGDMDAAMASVSLAIPKSDLSVELEEDCITKLGSKDGKASWKIRKQALDDVDAALKRCSGLLDTSGPRMKLLLELTRALRDRLADTQINLKPLAARVIGALLSAVDKSTQARLGKIVFAPLINVAMNDMKKPMRDASLSAIQAGTTLSSLEGGGVNDESLEEFVTALVAEVTERTSRAGGLPDVLLLLLNVVDSLPNLDNSSSSLGDKYAATIIECLTSSKSDTRAAASALLNASFEKEIVGMESIRRATERLKPAQQRTVMPQISKLQKLASDNRNGKENDVPVTEAPPSTQQRVSTTTNDSAPSGPRRPAPTKLPPSDVESPKDRKSPEHKASRHPLELRSGSHSPHASTRSHQNVVGWPEYPEEPQGSTLLATLKKCWTPLLPPATVTALFPASGIKKQDDAQEGCDLLFRAVELDRSNGGEVVESQLDFILKWLVYVLCSRETPVGLQALLSLTKDLLSFLLERSRQLSDAEALELVPFLLDKASVAKGRFHNLFLEVVSILQHEELLPTKRLGSTVCVAVMERSSHAKARALCYRMSIDCVEKEGLAGLGKKGVVVAAKSLSEETVPENRAASLDLLELILLKMNGDMQRLVRICGPILSNKANQLLEERWSNRERKEADGNACMVTHSSLKSPRQGRTEAGVRESPQTPRDQLPAFSLREGGRKLDGRFAQASSGYTPSSPSPQQHNDSIGGASALRARLLKIREKSKAYDSGGETALHDDSIQTAGSGESQNEEAVFAMGIGCLIDLVSIESPLTEEDSRLLECIEALKRFHAALSKQQYPAYGLNVMEFIRLREIIVAHLHETMECLTRLIRFALDCGDPSINAGMSIPLLSVCLATLMAFFRDPELSPSQDDLTLLIREAATALLDPRLAVTSDLDEATRSQMVRAINKLAVQAATGALRHVAFQSLVTLQQQLTLETDNLTDEDDEFVRRLSRVLSKLFARVMKAEEATPEPYSTESVDMEAVICLMEDCLVACQEAQAGSSVQPNFSVDASTEMVKGLMKSILESYESSAILAMMEDLGIDTPLLASVIASLGNIATEAAILEELQPSFEESPSGKEGTAKSRTTPKGSFEENETTHVSSNDVATLVSTLGSAPQGPEREAALDALRNYTAANGDEELVEHLKQVSPAFRDFIEDQLRSSSDATRSSDHPSHQNAGGGSMTDRLKSLRSRLEATEIVVQSAVEGQPQQQQQVHAASSSDVPPPVVTSSSSGELVGGERRTSPPSKIPSPTNGSNRPSRLAQPTPSKLVPPSQSLLERLASSQESRSGSSGVSLSATTTSSGVATSMGRAAALRARLEAVKQKNKM